MRPRADAGGVDMQAREKFVEKKWPNENVGPDALNHWLQSYRESKSQGRAR
jgi:hypothetical protein